MAMLLQQVLSWTNWQPCLGLRQLHERNELLVSLEIRYPIEIFKIFVWSSWIHLQCIHNNKQNQYRSPLSVSFFYY